MDTIINATATEATATTTGPGNGRTAGHTDSVATAAVTAATKHKDTRTKQRSRITWEATKKEKRSGNATRGMNDGVGRIIGVVTHN